MDSPLVPNPGRLRHALTILGAVGCAGLLAACSGSGLMGPHPQRPLGSHSAATQAPASSPAQAALGSPPPASQTGLSRPRPGLSDRLVLHRTQVRAGTVITGSLNVINRNHQPVNLSHGCRPQYAVTLANSAFPPDVAFSSDCSARPFDLRPGLNRLPVRIITTYQSCTLARGTATRAVPACLPGPRHRSPSLPAGQYQAVLVGTGLPLPAPSPVTVTLRRG
jgi:hypothetical protein